MRDEVKEILGCIIPEDRDEWIAIIAMMTSMVVTLWLITR